MRENVMSKRVTLGKEKILDKWSILIENAQEKGGDLIKNTAKFIDEFGIPEIKSEMVQFFPSKVPVLFGRVPKWAREMGRSYLMVTKEDIGKVNMYIGAQDYGKNLYVSWCLVCEPSIFDQIFSALGGEKGSKWVPVVEDLLQEEELTAYVTFVHHCLLKAIESLMLASNQDPSKIDRKSKGFLGVS